MTAIPSGWSGSRPQPVSDAPPAPAAPPAVPVAPAVPLAPVAPVAPAGPGAPPAPVVPAVPEAPAVGMSRGFPDEQPPATASAATTVLTNTTWQAADDLEARKRAQQESTDAVSTDPFATVRTSTSLEELEERGPRLDREGGAVVSAVVPREWADHEGSGVGTAPDPLAGGVGPGDREVVEHGGVVIRSDGAMVHRHGAIEGDDVGSKRKHGVAQVVDPHAGHRLGGARGLELWVAREASAEHHDAANRAGSVAGVLAPELIGERRARASSRGEDAVSIEANRACELVVEGLVEGPLDGVVALHVVETTLARTGRVEGLGVSRG